VIRAVAVATAKSFRGELSMALGGCNSCDIVLRSLGWAVWVLVRQIRSAYDFAFRLQSDLIEWVVQTSCLAGSRG
jgi:hypothetical protein